MATPAALPNAHGELHQDRATAHSKTLAEPYTLNTLPKGYIVFFMRRQGVSEKDEKRKKSQDGI